MIEIKFQFENVQQAAAFLGGLPAMAAPLPLASSEPVKEAKKEKAEKKPKPDDKPPTIDDLRSATNEFNKERGLAATLEVLGKFDAKRITDVKPEDYRAVISAFAAA
jgi:hypothetical protein